MKGSKVAQASGSFSGRKDRGESVFSVKVAKVAEKSGPPIRFFSR